MDLLPVRCDESAYADYVGLFAKCFPRTSKFTRDYLDWLYRCNPDGQVVGFDARDGGRLVAHYVCIPARAEIGGNEVRVLLSLNTATHPDYQGQGLFTQLAELTYATGASQGFDCVYGVANANSTPGFTRKLNFQLVGSLQAMVGAGPVGIDFSKLTSLQFRRTWSAQALAWRCASPANPLISRREHDRTTFLAPSLFGGACMAVAEINDSPSTVTALESNAAAFISPLRLFIGHVPAAAQRKRFFVDIPKKWRPSPLNLIYRSLSGRFAAIEQDAFFLHFLDFDAY